MLTSIARQYTVCSTAESSRLGWCVAAGGNAGMAGRVGSGDKMPTLYWLLPGSRSVLYLLQSHSLKSLNFS